MQVCEDQGEVLTLNTGQYFEGDCGSPAKIVKAQRQLKWVSAPFPWQLITWLLGKTNEDCVLFHYDMSVLFSFLFSLLSVHRRKTPIPAHPQ